MSKTYRIEDDIKKETILAVLSEKSCRMILHSIRDKSKTVFDISGETKVPVSTVYRKLDSLQEIRLIATSGTINEEGKKLFLYKSRIKEIRTQFENGNLDVNIIFNQTNQNIL